VNLAQLYEGRARKYNHYEDSGKLDESHSCKTCLRRHFSHPWTCLDGWPLGDYSWKDRGYTCLNWTDDPDTPTD